MAAYVRFEITRALRNPRFLVLVAVVPVALYMVGLHSGQGTAGAIDGVPVGVWFLASSAALGSIAAALSGSGARLAAERASGWTRQLRVTPLSDTAWLIGRILSSVAIVIPVVAVVALLAATVGHVELDTRAWVQLLATLVIGAVPIALIGLAIGLSLRAEAAQAGQAVVFLFLAFVGGVFANSSTPPPGLGIVSHLSPSYYLLTTARAAARGVAPAGLDAGALILMTMVLGAVVVGLRRHSD